MTAIVAFGYDKKPARSVPTQEFPKNSLQLSCRGGAVAGRLRRGTIGCVELLPVRVLVLDDQDAVQDIQEMIHQLGVEMGAAALFHRV